MPESKSPVKIATRKHGREERWYDTTFARSCPCLTRLCDLTDEDAQEATVRACRSVNPGIIILGISRTVSRNHFEFRMTFVRGNTSEVPFTFMILTESEDALSEEHYVAIKTLQRNEGSAWLGRDLRQVEKVGLQPSCLEPCSRVDQFIHDGRAYSTRSDSQRRTVAQRRAFPFAENCDTR